MQVSTGVGGLQLVSDRLARCCELCQAGKLLHRELLLHSCCTESCKHLAKMSKPLARVELFGGNTFTNLI